MKTAKRGGNDVGKQKTESRNLLRTVPLQEHNPTYLLDTVQP